jgi:hypothetical protein
VRAIVLVEGDSDRIAVETLTTRVSGALHGVDIVSMGGATNVRTYLGDIANNMVVLGLCDLAEASLFRRAGIAEPDCFVCVADLEDELIRSLGVDAVLEVVEAEGHLRSFRTMQKQPAQRGRAIEAQLRRFIGSHSGFKLRYAKRLTEAAVDQTRVPAPLQSLLHRLDR